MDDDGVLHIVVFPWLAFGHLLPFLELSKSLAEKGHRIAFLSTPRNIQRLPKIPPHLTPRVELISLPLPQIDGLPENAEATTDLLPEKVQFLEQAFDGLGSPFHTFLEETSSRRKPDWIIHDFNHWWLAPVAAKFQVPCAFLSIFPASFLAFFGPPSELSLEGSRRAPEHFTSPPRWISSSSKLAYRLHEAHVMMGSYHTNASGMSVIGRYFLTLQQSRFVAVRSCTTFDSEWLALLAELYQKPIIPIGLLPPPAKQKGKEDLSVTTATEAKIFEWLDKQTPGSVVYVAFGSEASLNAELVHELALGLELSKIPFLWALRRRGSTEHDEKGILPHGFEDRNKDHGIVVTSWLPQLKALAHTGVASFLTHCGWSSIIEGLSFGHAVVMLPLFGDQGLTARELAEKGIGVEVERNEEDGAFDREAVAKAIRMVMGDEGEAFRSRAKELRGIFANSESQERYIDEFAQYLRTHRGNQG